MSEVNMQLIEQRADEIIARAKAAADIAETMTQEQADRIVRNIGKVIFDNAELLAKEAIEETGMGTMASKIKLNCCGLVMWDYMKDKKSVGVIENDKEARVITMVKPMGVIACVTPTTNTATPVHNAMIALKGRNVVVFCAHPRAVNNCKHMVQLMCDEIEKLGWPRDFIQVAEPCCIEMTNAIMHRADAIVATGGKDMVTAAYSSGKPSFGVGQGNVQCIMHPSWKDYDAMVSAIIATRSQDNGVPCIGEQCLFVPADVRDEILEVFRSKGSYVVEDPEQVAMIRDAAFINGAINRKIVGQLPYDVCRIAGFEIPKDTKFLAVKMGDAFGKDEPLCREVMCPMTRVFGYETFEQGVEMARANLRNEGAIEHAADRLPVCRVMINMGNGAAGMGKGNGLNPTNSVGCGSWGGNSISENLTYKHLLNMTKIAYPIPNAKPLDPAEVWGD